MKIKDIMTSEPIYMLPGDTVQQVAEAMKKHNTGMILIGENDRLTGVITDRDIATRIVAAGKNPAQTPASEAMTPGILYCFEDQNVEEVADNMKENTILRLIVLNRGKRLTGIVSHSDIADAASSDSMKSKVTLLACKKAA